MSQLPVSEDDSDLQDELLLLELTEQLEKAQSSADKERQQRMQQLDVILYVWNNW